MKRNIDVIAAGHICLDIIPVISGERKKKIDEVLVPGKLLNVGAASISTGGTVSNTGIALIRLGLSVELMGKVGNDFFGKAILSKLKEEKAEKGMVVVDNEATSYTVVLAPPGIDRMFLHNPGTNDTFGFEDVSFQEVKKAKVFHFGYPPLMKRIYRNNGEELARIFKEAKKCGAATSLDMALPDPESPSGKADWNRILKDALPYVDLFLPSVEEALFMLDKDKFFRKREKAGGRNLVDFLEIEEISWIGEKMVEYGVAVAGIKCGHKGMYLRTSQARRLKAMGKTKLVDVENWSDRELLSPPFTIRKFISAVGSGDSCVAGFLAAFVRGESVERALDYACALGAENLEAPDALSGVKSWQETTRMLKAGWEKQETAISNPSWRFDEKSRLWKGPNVLSQARKSVRGPDLSRYRLK